MANLTSKELSAIEDQLGIEQNMVKKFQMFSKSCTDASLKQKCEYIANKHQAHYDMLRQHLN